MKKNTMLLNQLLTAVLAIGLLIGMVWRSFQPNVVLPKLDLPAMAALILIALLLEYFLTGTKKRVWGVQILFAAATFWLLPTVAGLKTAGIKTMICGTAAFVILTILFDWTAERTEVSGNGKGAMAAAAFCMYLACQCFMGMWL